MQQQCSEGSFRAPHFLPFSISPSTPPPCDISRHWEQLYHPQIELMYYLRASRKVIPPAVNYIQRICWAGKFWFFCAVTLVSHWKIYPWFVHTSLSVLYFAIQKEKRLIFIINWIAITGKNLYICLPIYWLVSHLWNNDNIYHLPCVTLDIFHDLPQ